MLLSLWVFADSRYAPLLKLMAAGRLLPLSSQECLGEFERVLGYPEFKLDQAAQRVILDDYAGRAQCIVRGAGETPSFPLPLCRDGDDQKFLELARDGRADYLVTNDKALLKLARRKRLIERFRIVTPERFLGEPGLV